MVPPVTTEADLIREASRGLDLLLNDDLPGAKQLLASRPTSCWHLVGSGLVSFIVSALGVEDKELSLALETLTKAEHAANKGKAKAETPPPGHWWPKGSEFDVLVADTVIAQALVHILTESYLEFLKAIYKLNRAYKLFSHSYKVIFPHGVKETDSLDDIVNLLNSSYMAARLSPPQTPKEKGMWGFSKKAQSLDIRSNSHVDLRATMRHTHPDVHTSAASSATAPVTPHEATTPVDGRHDVGTMASMIEENLRLTHVRPNWLHDDVAQLVIGGSLFGHGLFELVFAMLPPKLRKITSWIGYSYGNRTVALRLLSVASMGTDVHASFASLVLLTYYGLVLLMSGWQANRSAIIERCQQVLAHIKQRLPDGTLWLLNEAKLERMMGHTDKALDILISALHRRDSHFEQAETVLQFELAWCQASLCRYGEAAKSFLRMREVNQWSHATYTLIAAGCLVDLLRENEDDAVRDQLDSLVATELPSMLGKKRLMGQPPPSEAFVSAKLDFWNKKRDRWAAQGRLGPKGRPLRACDVISISPLDELGLHWQTFAHMPRDSAKKLIAKLSALTPPPTPSTASLAAVASSPSTHHDLDTTDELVLRATLLGILSRQVSDLRTSAAYLDAVIARGTGHLDEGHTYLVAVAHFESAILQCAMAEAEVSALRANDPNEARQVWQRCLRAAEKHVDEVFKQGTFLMQSRTESRSQMLRTELLGKREQVALEQ